MFWINTTRILQNLILIRNYIKHIPKDEIMILKIVPIGNSQGIRLKKALLVQCHISDKV